MLLTLSNEEQELLAETLNRYLSDLRMEITRTDSRQFKARLRHHEQIIQGLIEKLGSA
ncbi:MAG: hypothetical protein HY613_00995 [Candidatus Rokubacteria bacterium]|nr:hypothetical protein [Candidatus Rokubacteria bacterium]